DKLSGLRRALYHRATADQKKVLKGSRSRLQRCCKTLADPRLCHSGGAAPAEARLRTATSVHPGSGAAGEPRDPGGGVTMNTPPRRLPSPPPISRRYEPSRLQSDSLIVVYSLIMKDASHCPGSCGRRPGEPDRADGANGHRRSLVVGA